MLLTMVGIVTYAMGRWRRSLVIVGVVLVWGYAMFVGLPPPTFRAALLATMAAGARMSGRPVDFVSLTLLAVPLQIAIRPEDAYSVSFHLSVAASFGLAAGFSRYPRIEQRHGLAELLTATAFAQLATLPIIIGVFGTAPLLSLPANIAAIPFAGFAFAVGLVGSLGLLIHTDLGTAMLIPAGWAADIVLRIAELFGQTWSQFQIGPFGDAWMVGLTLLAAFVLLGFGGELTLIRRQLSQRQGIQAENG
jgi:competence protein ComEC